MINTKTSSAVVSVLLSLLVPGLLFAQSTLENFPKSGLLAGQGGVNVSGGVTIQQLPTEADTPILGSVSLSKNKKWEFSVWNNSKEPLKVTVELVEVNGAAKIISSKSYTYRLKPGARENSEVAVDRSATGAGIRLKNWDRF